MKNQSHKISSELNDLNWETLHLPPNTSGQKIGLYGGSFNPPHSGHLLVAETALKKLQLDAIWWLVSPQNPLKSETELMPLKQRIMSCSQLTNNPAHKITAYETLINNNVSATTLSYIFKQCSESSFVWIMGADNLSSLHRWENWQYIMENIPIAVVSRPNFLYTANNSVVGKKYEKFRIAEADSGQLVNFKAPRWVFLNQQLDHSSSTRLRERGD